MVSKDGEQRWRSDPFGAAGVKDEDGGGGEEKNIQVGGRNGHAQNGFVAGQERRREGVERRKKSRCSGQMRSNVNDAVGGVSKIGGIFSIRKKARITARCINGI